MARAPTADYNTRKRKNIIENRDEFLLEEIYSDYSSPHMKPKGSQTLLSVAKSSRQSVVKKLSKMSTPR